MQQIIQSKTFKIAAAVFAGLFLLVLAFAGGVKVGLHKAKFSGNFDKHYEENFAGKGRGGDDRGGKDSRGNKGGMMGGRGMMEMGPEFRNGHGTAGEMVSVSGDTLILKDKDNQEISVRISDQSIVNRGKDQIGINDLIPGERLVVVGKPGEDGVIAGLIVRVLPNSKNEIQTQSQIQTQGGTQPENQSQIQLEDSEVQNEAQPQ
jgi:hypothetical protein